MTATTGLMIDGLLALLLVAAIVACVMVYRRLAQVRESQAEMASVVDNLNRAVAEAQSSIRRLRETATEVDATLSDKVKGARALADELALISEAGNNLADRIEKGLTDAKSRANSPDVAQDPTAPRGAVQTTTPAAGKKPAVGQKQKDLMSAIKQAR